MSNDMKLIMEEWARFVEQEGEKVVLRPVGVTDKPRVTRGKLEPKPWSVQNMTNPAEQILSDLEDWYFELSLWARVFVDLVDPTGLTDWPDARDAFRAYLDWYLLDYDDPRRDPMDGAYLFANAVVTLILAVPLFDLFGVIKLSLKTKGFGILKDVVPRMDNAQEVIVMLLRNGRKIVGFFARAWPALVVFHAGLQASEMEKKRSKYILRMKEMSEMAKVISDKEEELKELNRERFRAAARAAKRTKDNRKEDLDENNN